jgi:hypothetical protein
VTTLNANSSALAWQQTYTSPSYANGNHTVRLVHAGASGTYIDVDAIQIYGVPVTVSAGTYDDGHSAWTYTGAWAIFNGSGPYNNTVRYTTTVGNSVELLFTGTKFTLAYTKYSNRGLIDVYVDDVKVTTLNASSPSLLWQQTYVSSTFSAGSHTLRLVHAGGGTHIDVDAIQIE